MDVTIWDQILSSVETKVNRHSFYTWFKPTAFVADGGASITVRVPNTLFKDWLTKHYSIVLSEALAEVRRPGAALVFVAEGGAVAPPPAAIDEPPRVPDAGMSRQRHGFDGRLSELALHLRHLHRRTLESVCARGMPCGRGSAVPLRTTRCSSTEAWGSARHI